MQTVINHATVLTMDPEKHIYKDGYVVMEDNKILETGEGKGPENADCVVDGKGGILMPGMVNVLSGSSQEISVSSGVGGHDAGAYLFKRPVCDMRAFAVRRNLGS